MIANKTFVLRTMLLCSVVVLLFSDCIEPTEPGALVRKTVDQDATLPSLKFNGSHFHLETFGNKDNQAVIFLHGGPGADYRSLLSFTKEYNGYNLADDYYLIFWDQRGCGLSKRHDESMLTLETYLQDLEILVDIFAPDNKSIIFITHSWGGQYAAMYMDAHPDRIAGAVFLEPGPFSKELSRQKPGGNVSTLDYSSEWLNDLLWLNQMVGSNNHEEADYMLANTFFLAGPDLQPQRHEIQAEPSTANEWRSAAAVLIYMFYGQLVNGTYDFTANLHKVAAPVLFIAGGATEDLGEEFQKKQRILFQESNLKIISEAGHVDIITSRADESIMYIRGYLQKLQSRKNNVIQ